MPRLIDADALMSRIEDSARNAGLHSEDYRKIKRFIATTHTIDAEPVRHGRWVDDDCSVCGFPIPTDDRLDAIFEEEVKYCYHCGAKMDGGAEE